MELSSKNWISLALSMKYITNATILASIVGYYTQAYSIFLISIPLLMTNAIVMTLLEWFNANELIAAILDIPVSHKAVIDVNKIKFIFLNTVWHLLPLAWVWYILAKDNLIEIFRPNFMGCFLASVSIGLSYFYFASHGKFYGEINYSWYMVAYVIILFTVCVYVFMDR